MCKHTSENVPVSLFRSVDFPTEGNPTSPTLESPLFVTSNPSPAPPPFDDGGAKISLRSFANFAYCVCVRKHQTVSIANLRTRISANSKAIIQADLK